jgi:hypothetical protein
MSMVWIASSGTLVSNTSTIDFSNIPNQFSHLQVRIFGRGTTTFGGGLSMYFTPYGFSQTATRRNVISGNGTSAYIGGDSGSGVSGLVADGGALANVFSSIIYDILDWNSSNKNITGRAIGGYDSNGGTGIVTMSSSLNVGSGSMTGFYLNTDGNWVAGSRVDLYGITSSQVTGA